MPSSFADRRAVVAGLFAFLAAPATAAQNHPPLFDVVWSTRLTLDQRTALESWTKDLEALAQGWWPVITTALASPGFTPASRITLDISAISPKTIPAMTNGTRITVDAGYVLSQIRNPDRSGMVAHEMVHVAQAYPPGAPPFLTEGIADYLRYYVLLPNDINRGFDPRGRGPWAGYQSTAALLDWIERQHPGAVQATNADLRDGGDGFGPLKRFGGGDITRLWRAYLATSPPAATPEAEQAAIRALSPR
ncbi:basic secretory protein-like protein [Phenylobacterium sp.]|jgi:hypothetical protein|uniref:basic secretory protein-like protein n=1 Tax=Phenylobacterium sp. TaxID=1871053 RepID=UPI002E2F4247|nr:basic secretory protein-like protein [Phenylobacterium sp.]HEX3365152.1 basic secretory protein-like protein [Phenylobacterium sp.]